MRILHAFLTHSCRHFRKVVQELHFFFNDLVLPDVNEMPHFLEKCLRQVKVMMMFAFGENNERKASSALESAELRYRVSAWLLNEEQLFANLESRLQAFMDVGG